jgi:Bacteriophage replication gene A protein (GPA)
MKLGMMAPAPMLAGFPFGETLRDYRALTLEERTRRQYEAWAKSLTKRFPKSWQQRLIETWGQRHAADESIANTGHRKICDALDAVATAGLDADANDDQVCDVAMKCAREAGRRIDVAQISLPEEGRTERAYAAAKAFVIAHGLTMPEARNRPWRAVLARLRCDRWWRRALRRVHGRALEGAAREIGLVNLSAGCYASDDAVKSRRAQVHRNARALESVEAMNDHGHAYTLAELAAKSTANKEIRRHELMTRVAGFDQLAIDLGDRADFVTLTCPSRMHRSRVRRNGGGAEDNPKFDGTLPREAQAWMTGQFAKLRAALARAGLRLYGFRIVEPNHDGTPHWHLLLFYAGGADEAALLLALLRRYFLEADSADERGAEEHRVKVEPIDRARGSAAGYVAKYIAKNIDGYKVEKDLFGNDAITSSLRVETWAARWGIRQFQQIGGAPVTTWRELRRVHPEQASAAAPVAMAIEAVNITSSAKKIDDVHDLAQRETAATGWATYVHLQGGPTVERKELRYRLLIEQTGEIGRYGDVLPPKTIGIECAGGWRSEPLLLYGWGHGPDGRMTKTPPRRVSVEVESERCSWVVVPAPRGSDETKEQARERLRSALARGEAARPRSPVNNCTPRRLTGWAAIKALPIDRHQKRGRWRDFTRKKEGAT